MRINGITHINTMGRMKVNSSENWNLQLTGFELGPLAKEKCSQ